MTWLLYQTVRCICRCRVTVRYFRMQVLGDRAIFVIRYLVSSYHFSSIRIRTIEEKQKSKENRILNEMLSNCAIIFDKSVKKKSDDKRQGSKR